MYPPDIQSVTPSQFLRRLKPMSMKINEKMIIKTLHP